MTFLLITGSVGLVVLLLSLAFDGLLDVFDVDLGSGFLSLPAVAAFLTALGYGGALGMYAGLPAPAAVGIGVLAGVVVGAIGGWAARGLTRSATDATPKSADLVGLVGMVITPVPADGFGEISLVVGGASSKLAARSAQALAAGTPVVVTAVLSPTAVLVDAQ